MESTSAHEFDRRLAGLIRSERHLAVQFVVELAAFAKQELYRELGYTSLFSYCVRQLGLSKASAFRRSEAAHLIARFPVIAEHLAERRLTIRALIELREVLTEENHASVLARAAGKSPEEAQLLAVEIRPRPVPRDVVRTLVPVETRMPPRPSFALAAESLVPAASAEAATQLPPAEAPSPPGAAVSLETRPARRPPEVVKPLTPGLRRLNVTVSAGFIGELEQVRAALSHQCPDGDFEQVVREAFRLVLERDRKRKALSARPRQATPGLPGQPPPSGRDDRCVSAATTNARHVPAATNARYVPAGTNARYVPAAVKRAVWERDRGRCTWPMGDGSSCGATHRLEFDHDLEVALGGKPTFDNIRLLCRSHNLMKAEERLGRARMARFRKNWPRSETAAEPGSRPARGATQVSPPR